MNKKFKLFIINKYYKKVNNMIKKMIIYIKLKFQINN